MQLRAELVIHSDESEARRTVEFHDVGINRISQFSSIGLKTLHETVRNNRAVELLLDSSPIARRTVNRDGIRPSLGRIRLTFRLGRRTREDLVHVVPGTAQLQVGTDIGVRLRIIESIWEVSSDSDDSEIEHFMREYQVRTGPNTSKENK